MSDPLKDHFVRTVPRGSELPERGVYLGDGSALQSVEHPIEVTITDAMLEAGAAAYEAKRGANTVADALAEIYTAMNLAAPQVPEDLAESALETVEHDANPHETWEAACDVTDRLIGVFKRGTTLEEAKEFERRIDHLDLRAVAADIVDYAMSKRDGSSGALLSALIRQIELGDYTDKHGHKLTDNVCFIEAKEAAGE
jgi:hypothetical protein